MNMLVDYISPEERTHPDLTNVYKARDRAIHIEIIKRVLPTEHHRKIFEDLMKETA